MKTIPRYSPTTMVRPSASGPDKASGDASGHNSALSRAVPSVALLAAAAALAAFV